MSSVQMTCTLPAVSATIAGRLELVGVLEIFCAGDQAILQSCAPTWAELTTVTSASAINARMSRDFTLFMSEKCPSAKRLMSTDPDREAKIVDYGL